MVEWWGWMHQERENNNIIRLPAITECHLQHEFHALLTKQVMAIVQSRAVSRPTIAKCVAAPHPTLSLYANNPRQSLLLVSICTETPSTAAAGQHFKA